MNTQGQQKAEPIVAVVTNIILEGEHGPYAVTYDKNPSGMKESITFSLDSSLEIWKEQTQPEKGVSVVLENLIHKEAGWRALSARFFRIEDEHLLKSAPSPATPSASTPEAA